MEPQDPQDAETACLEAARRLKTAIAESRQLRAELGKWPFVVRMNLDTFELQIDRFIFEILNPASAWSPQPGIVSLRVVESRRPVVDAANSEEEAT